MKTPRRLKFEKKAKLFVTASFLPGFYAEDQQKVVVRDEMGRKMFVWFGLCVVPRCQCWTYDPLQLQLLVFSVYV